MALFIVYYNNEMIKTYNLNEPVITIGRLPENTISIANMGVSRRHVKIEEDTDHTYLLTDLNSLNGTFVNGKRIKKVTLHDGDKISIGKYTIVYREKDENRVSEITANSSVGPSKPEPKEYIGAQEFDLNYIHRTTEPRMKAISEKKILEEPSNLDLDSGIPTSTKTSEKNSAVLIETNKHVVYKIDKKYMTIGNSEEDDIFISGLMIGPRHVSIEVGTDGIYIHTSSIFGRMKINGKPKRYHRLQHKDRIEISSNTFRFMENG